VTRWHESQLAGFDTETTSADPFEARIVTAAVLARGPDPAWDDFRWMADPGIEIPAEATAVHGVTTAQAREHGRPAAQVAAEVLEVLHQHLLVMPLVIYNAAYDLTVLEAEARRYGLPPLDLSRAVIIDPHVLDKQLDRYRKGSRRLDATCAHYRVQLADAHDPMQDALAAMRIAWRLGQAYPWLSATSGRKLMDWQAKARRAQCASLAAYFAKTGQPQEVNGDWPVQRQPEGARP